MHRVKRMAALVAVTVSALAVSPVAAAQAAPIAWGVNVDNAPGPPEALDAFTGSVGARPALVMWYQQFSEPLFYASQMADVAARGATPLITWEPAMDGRGIPLRDVAAGRHDDVLARAAASAKEFGGPLLIRLGHEMNLPVSPWGPTSNGNTPAEFVAMWRHVVGLFRAAGADNVRWVWSPNVDDGTHPFSAMYPGDEWVDWVGLDGYNWGTTRGGGPRSLSAVFASSYATAVRLSSRPVMIAETAAAEQGGDKAAWIRQGLLADVPVQMPRVRAVIWFERVKETDWRVGSSPASLDAFRSVVASPLYTSRLEDALSAPLAPVAPRPAAAALREGSAIGRAARYSGRRATRRPGGRRGRSAPSRAPRVRSRAPRRG